MCLLLHLALATLPLELTPKLGLQLTKYRCWFLPNTTQKQGSQLQKKWLTKWAKNIVLLKHHTSFLLSLNTHSLYNPKYMCKYATPLAHASLLPVFCTMPLQQNSFGNRKGVVWWEVAVVSQPSWRVWMQALYSAAVWSQAVSLPFLLPASLICKMEALVLPTS